MDAAKHVLAVSQVALYQSHMMLARDVVYVAVDVEFAVFGGKFCLCLADYMLFVYAAIILQGLNRDVLEAEFFCHFLKFLAFHHLAVVVHDFTAKTALFKTCKAAQVYRCLSVTVAHQNPAFFCNKGEHVAWPAEIRGHGRGVNAFLRRD